MRCYLNEHFVCVFLIELVMLKSVSVFSYLSCQLSSENVCCITTYRKNAKLQNSDAGKSSYFSQEIPYVDVPFAWRTE